MSESRESRMVTLTPTGTFCSVCEAPQHNTPSGVSCPNGHGGAAAQQQGGRDDMNWIRMSDRRPTLDDADESGTVWVYDNVFADVSSVHFYRADSPYYTHWMPKEKRPAPPAPKEDSDD